MDRLAALLGRLAGWRRAALAFALGALATLALAPLHLIPFLVPAFAGLIWLTAASAGPRQAFAAGWWFGLGHFLTGFYWIANAFAVAGVAEWLAPLAVAGLAAVSAAFPGLACALTRALPVSGARAVVAFAVAWTLGEWLRGTVILGGFPWNLIGYAWMASDTMIQLAAVTGVYGLSLLTVAAAGMPAILAGPGRPASAPARHAWRPLAWTVLALALVWLGGTWRLAGAHAETVPDVRLRLVQANIAQHHKWRADLRRDHLRQHIALTREPGGTPPSQVIWPETATPYLLSRVPQALDAIARAVPQGGLLLTGAVRAAPPEAATVEIWNSLQVIDEAGAIVGTYDKAHLVPFGEYVPLRRFLPFAKLTHGETDYSPGPGPRTLRLPGLPPFSPLICYEAIFPGQVLDGTDRPDWLLNITNDAWYGLSAGPYQHMAQARLRTVEEGLPLVRVANTGISAVVDGYGRVAARLGLGERGVLDVALPAPAPGRTPYSRLGELPLAVIMVLAAAWAWRGRRGA